MRNERLGRGVASRGRLEFSHHCLEEFFDVIGGERGVGLVVGWRDVGVAVFVVYFCWFRFLLVDGHVVYELFKLFVNDVRDDGDIVG